MKNLMQRSKIIAPLSVLIFFAYSANLSAAPQTFASQPSQSLYIAMMDEMGMGASKSGSSMPSDTMASSGSQGSMADSTPSSGMDMMGKMRGSMLSQQSMNRKTPRSNLPGFPGASHLYHIGATSFFLDHPQHISLSISQQKSLNLIKENSMLDQSETDRRIEDAEQELWVLTSADSPNAVKIEVKIQSIEKLRSTQRINFIRAVGEAAKVLTPEQRNALLGNGPASMQAPAGQAAPMKDM